VKDFKGEEKTREEKELNKMAEGSKGYL